MAVPIRLVTFVEVDDHADDTTISVSARHEVELADRSRSLLLDDRGWSASGPPDIWARTSAEDLVSTARTVVGPDEPLGGRSPQQTETDHWEALAAILRGRGHALDALELARLPHDVVLSEQILRRLGLDR